MSTFGERLRRLRERRRLSIQDLADRSGVPYATIYRVEQGIHQEPRVSIAARLARALGVTLDELAGMYRDDDDADDPASVCTAVA